MRMMQFALVFFPPRVGGGNMTLLSGTRRVNWCRTPVTLLAILGFATNARAATRGVSDAELIGLGYLFVGVPVYVVLMVAALVTRSLEKGASGRTASRSIRSCANLLPIT